MNEAVTAHVLLATALRRLIATVRDTRQRVLVSAEARGCTDEEALHDFRVALRRMRTHLRTARRVWQSKRIERIENELRYYARVTGALRDDEVLHGTLASIGLPQIAADEVNAWLARRARTARSARRSILRIVREGPSNREADSAGGKRIRPLDDVLDKLERLLDMEPQQPLVASVVARDAIERALRDVRRAAQADVDDANAMHALRIREKRLRYTAELFANELGEEAQTLQQHATRMQRRLGELHDLDEALVVVTHARSLASAAKQATVAALRGARSARAAKVEPHLIEARGVGAHLVAACNDPHPTPSS